MFKFLQAACIVLLGAAPAAAQVSGAPVANGQKFGAWTVNCQAIATNQTVCVLAQQLLRTSDQAFLAQVMAFWAADQSKIYLSSRVPVGAYLPSGLAMRAASGESILEMTWQSCSSTLCEALVEINSETLETLAAEGETVISSFRPTLQSDPIVFSYSMVGAIEGLAALRDAAPLTGNN